MRTHILQQIIQDRPETAILVSNKYKVLAGMLQRMFPELKDMSQAKLADIVFEAVNGDRDWRTLTEGQDKQNKTVLEQKKKVELGYVPNEEWFNNLK